MDMAKVAFEALRAAAAISAFIKSFAENASSDQMKEFVRLVHESGGTVDLKIVDDAIADMKASGAALDAKLSALGD